MHLRIWSSAKALQFKVQFIWSQIQFLCVAAPVYLGMVEGTRAIMVHMEQLEAQGRVDHMAVLAATQAPQDRAFLKRSHPIIDVVYKEIYLRCPLITTWLSQVWRC